MSKQYSLMVDDETLGIGVLAVSKDGSANFFRDTGQHASDLIRSMERTRLDWAGAEAMCLSGFEVTGHDHTGRRVYRHVEWFLRYQ